MCRSDSVVLSVSFFKQSSGFEVALFRFHGQAAFHEVLYWPRSILYQVVQSCTGTNCLFFNEMLEASNEIAILYRISVEVLYCWLR